MLGSALSPFPPTGLLPSLPATPVQVCCAQRARAPLSPITHPSVSEGRLLILPLSSSRPGQGTSTPRFFLCPSLERPGISANNSNITAPLRFRVCSSGVRLSHLHFLKQAGFHSTNIDWTSTMGSPARTLEPPLWVAPEGGCSSALSTHPLVQQELK